MGGCDRAGVSEGIMCMCVCMCLENSVVGRFSRGSPIGILGSIQSDVKTALEYIHYYDIGQQQLVYAPNVPCNT